MKYRFYLNSEKAWGAMLKEILNAQKNIYLEMYILADNTEDHDFFGALIKKAREGVKVRVIIDSFGSYGLPKETLEEVEKAGIEILFYGRLFHRTHRKILIVDDKTAFLGGVNIHKLFRRWDDLQVRLRGSIVKSVLKSFARAYEMCGGKDEEVLTWKDVKIIFGRTKSRILERWRENVGFSFKRYYKRRMGEARESIEIITPYFVPNRWFAKILAEAVDRGVKIRMIIPKKTDNWLADRANYFYMFRFFKIGIKFCIFPHMNHAKAILVDDIEGMVGSPNVDIFSLEYNAEIGIFFQQKEAVADLKKIIGKWEKQCVPFDPLVHKPKWFDYLLSPIFKIFHRMF